MPSFKATLRGTALLASLVPLGLYAQSGGGAHSEPPRIYSAGQPHITPSDTAGQNVLSLDTAYQGSYNSNPLGVSSGAAPDFVQNMSAHALFMHNTDAARISIDYLPAYQKFQRNKEWDEVDQPLSYFNQFLSAAGEFQLSPQWSMQLRDDFSKVSGAYLPETLGFNGAGVGSPTGLNGTIYTPLDTELGNSSRVDIGYQRSPRTSFDFFADHEMRSFSGVGGGDFLSDTRGNTAGAQVAWRSTEHTTVGALYIFERLNAIGPLTAGFTSRVDIQSVLPTAGWRPSSSVGFTVFGGPQVVSLGAVGSSATKNRLEWAGGATATVEQSRTALMLNVQRIVTDGGGLLPFATSSSASIELTRQLPMQWEAMLNVAVGRNGWLDWSGASGTISSGTGTLRMTHRLGRSLAFVAGYSYIRQRSPIVQIVGGNFERSEVTAGLTYRLGAIPLGR